MKRLRWFVIALLIGLFLFLFRIPILVGIGQFLVVQDPLTDMDVIHVLGGGKERIDYAITLYNQGYANHLFVTGGNELLPPMVDTYGQLIIQYAKRYGVPSSAIWSGTATSTYEDALALKRLLEKHPYIKSVIILSSPYHMRRVRMIFKEVFTNQIQLIFRHVPWSQSKAVKRWWTDEESLLSVQNEYIKLIYYYIKYIF